MNMVSLFARYSKLLLVTTVITVLRRHLQLGNAIDFVIFLMLLEKNSGVKP